MREFSERRTGLASVSRHMQKERSVADEAGKREPSLSVGADQSADRATVVR